MNVKYYRGIEELASANSYRANEGPNTSLPIKQNKTQKLYSLLREEFWFHKVI